jgi:hypothetical protein
MGSEGIKYSSLQTKKGAGFGCIGLALKVVQTFTSFQGIGGIGFFHLNVPIGGAANGIPLKTFTFPSVLKEPATLPYVVEIISRDCWPWIAFVVAKHIQSESSKILYINAYLDILTKSKR